jgi:predicted RNase H-like HicB family nuclease
MALIVKATWDPEAKVWVAESDDVPGLITEADTIEALQKKLPGIIQDLLESDDEGPETEIAVELEAKVSSRVIVRRHVAA